MTSLALAALLLASPSPPFASCNVPTGTSATLLVPASNSVLVAGQPLEVGDHVAVLTPGGACAGSFAWTGQPHALAAWRDNPFSGAVDGLRPGEKIRLSVWRASTQRVHEHDVTFTFEASPTPDGTFLANKVYHLSGSSTVREETTPAALPALSLAPNAPNPFTSATTISYSLSEAAHAKLVVYDLLGRTVAVLVDEDHSAGTHTVSFERGTLASGTYVYRLQAGTQTLQRRMTVVR